MKDFLYVMMCKWPSVLLKLDCLDIRNNYMNSSPQSITQLPELQKLYL